MSAKFPRYVLDSFAIVAHFQDEAGGARVKSLLADGEKKRAEIYLTIINYGEVVYLIEREQGLPKAQEMVAALDQLPITVVEADRKLTFAAAHLKAHYPISYADAFALALAQEKQAILVTGDPEFRKVETLAQIEWLPRE